MSEQKKDNPGNSDTSPIFPWMDNAALRALLHEEHRKEKERQRRLAEIELDEQITRTLAAQDEQKKAEAEARAEAERGLISEAFATVTAVGAGIVNAAEGVFGAAESGVERVISYLRPKAPAKIEVAKIEPHILDLF